MSADSPINIDTAIHDLLKGPKYPDREFVRSGATFAEVYAMANRLRVALDETESRGTFICLVADDKAVIAAALLAALASGSTLLLPYAFSANIIAQMHQTIGFETALSDVDREFPEGVKVICPQSAEATDLRGPGPGPGHGHEARAQSELLQIFTGGSTGTPKIWSKTVENIFGEGYFQANRFAVTKNDCILATIPPYHIYGLLFSVVVPLVSSATVINETPSFPSEIVRIAKKYKSTILASVPAHYRALRERKMSLRLAFSSAGVLDAADNEAFCRHNKIGVVEVYGSTETGGIATRNMAQGEEFFTPFPTIDWKITDHRLAVRSPYISPELPIDAKGFFTTNDRVEAIGTKSFSLKGRSDTVTKVGGKRVDLDEISLFIKKQAGVTDCVTLAMPESGGREHLIGTLIQGDTVNMEMIKKTLAETFEPYALPRRMKTVARIPLKNNGKYDLQRIVQLLEK
jgi:acyl-coenzyme A synthetase/AMP-(fatty) acid ligase